MEIVQDRNSPASARAAAARTLLDELARRGNIGERSLSAMSAQEIEAELAEGETVGKNDAPSNKG